MRVLLILLTLTVSSALALTPEEERLTARVDAGIPNALRLLEQTVNLNSGTFNTEGVRRVAEPFRREFEARGFTARWVEGDSWGRAGHLIAQRAGDGSGPHVLFIGHLDTVFEPDSHFQRFERVDEHTARGPGVIDMKGGIVVMLLALDSLVDTPAATSMTITVVLTGDEENPGSPLSAARDHLMEAAREADLALGFEDGDGNPETAVIARRGYTGWRLEVTGRASHSSQVFRDDVGAGAIYETARILNRFREELGGNPLVTFNPGAMVGGTDAEFDAQSAAGTAFGKPNVVAGVAVVTGDLRTLTMEQLASTKSTMQSIAQANLPHTAATLTFTDGYPPLAPLDGNRKLLSMLDQASRDLGFGPVTAVDPARAGAADISFTAGYVEAALDGLGLMGTGGHTVEETADLRTLGVQAQRVGLLLYRLAAQHQRTSDSRD